MSTKNKIKIIGIQITEMLEKLQGIHRMIRGSYGKSYRRCGKPNCWCSHAEKGHPHHRITWSKDAKPGSRIIPQDDIEWIKEMTQNYREYRQLRAKLRQKTIELKKILDMREEEVIVKTTKMRDYL